MREQIFLLASTTSIQANFKLCSGKRDEIKLKIKFEYAEIVLINRKETQFDIQRTRTFAGNLIFHAKLNLTMVIYSPNFLIENHILTSNTAGQVRKVVSTVISSSATMESFIYPSS